VTAEKKGKIFFVEDDVDLLEMLTAYFQVQGYDVASALRGREAIRAIGEEIPDVVVLDINLPDITGYEVCRRMRRKRRTQQIPVIFLTQKVERKAKLAGLELGAVDYITKPFDIQELRLRVRNTLRRINLGATRNPVTGLPEGFFVQERLEQMLRQPEWAVVLAGVRGLKEFRDQYGFVTADDVSRAVTLMIANAVQEAGDEDDFVGHTESGEFVIITTPGKAANLADRCLVRLRPSIQYFYPAAERPQLRLLPETDRLSVRVSTLASSEKEVVDTESLFAALESKLL
jgi:PleD family two-component response regulator